MKYKYLILPILTLILLGGACQKKTTNTSGNNGYVSPSAVEKVCAFERYSGKVWKCKKSTGEEYYRTTPSNLVADAPDGIYDDGGNLIINCNGLVPVGISERNRPLCEKYPQENCTDLTSSCTFDTSYKEDASE